MTEPERNEIADLVGPFWSPERTREALGLSPAALDEQRAAGAVLGVVTTDGNTFYPVDQFQRTQEGQTRVKPALRPLLEALRDHDGWTVGVILHTPAPELDDLTPLDWIRDGGSPETLLEFARTVASEWAR